MTTEREYMGPVKGIFETPFGPMDFTLTEANHVSISAGSSYDKSGPIVVNSVLYNVNLHLFQKEDGVWVQDTRGGSGLYMSRAGSFQQNNATSAAEKKTVEGIIPAWEDFIFGKEYLLMEAEVAHLNNEIRDVDEKFGEAQKHLATIEDERRALLQAEQEVFQARAEFGKQGGYPTPKDWSPTGHYPRERE